jgi:drug/metabolite transporter (DMT)-like permease
VIAVVLAVMFLGEELTPAVIAGAALIVTGVILAERSTKNHVPEPGVVTAG